MNYGEINYIGNIHFNDLLKQSLMNDNNIIINDEITTCKDNNCLITQETLDETHIELECGHKFNYYSIYNELKQQVQGSYKLGTECPYCRAKIKGVLPYCSGYKKIERVNHPSSRVLKKYKDLRCNHILTRGKNKGKYCSKPPLFPNNLCSAHEKMYSKMNIPVSKNTKVIEEDHAKKKVKCIAIIQSGKNAGNKCNCNVYVSASTPENKWYCGKHKKYLSTE